MEDSGGVGWVGCRISRLSLGAPKRLLLFAEPNDQMGSASSCWAHSQWTENSQCLARAQDGRALTIEALGKATRSRHIHQAPLVK